MNKKLLTLCVLGIFTLLLSLSLGSAYGGYFGRGYGGYSNDYFDSFSYSSARSSGYGPYVRTSFTDFGRTTSGFWDGRDYVKTTTYAITTRGPPSYGRYGYGGYSGYNYGYSPSYGYANYGHYPWYQKYWGY